jgi:adenosylcobinamide kinase/adenosylcobinamide-phosphate guanylyltransferase
LITFIIGGARSGKSGFALKSGLATGGPRAYIATAQALDEEMKARIERHRRERSQAWHTLEEPLSIAGLLGDISGSYRVIVIDCLTLWLSNIMGEGKDPEAATADLIEAAVACDADLFIVSNEVGLGIVPDNGLARAFRDAAGLMNRRMAEAADRVYLLAAGIPLKVK